MLESQSLDLIVDTRALVNAFDRRTYDQIKTSQTKLQKSNAKVFPYGSDTPLQIVGKTLLNLTVGNKTHSVEFQVIPGKGRTLLGRKSATEVGLLHVGLINSVSTSSCADQGQAQECNEILGSFQDRFQGIGKLKDFQLKLHIDKTVTPVAQPLRRVPFKMRAKIENKIDELEQLDIIEKVQGPTPWTSNLVCIPKKDNDIRLCLDLRQANKAVQRERFPMPNVEDTLEQMNNSSVFSRLDLKQSFHQIELEESSRYITTFVCSKGLYRYKRLLFGVNSAPEMHQRIIQQLLQDIPNCRNIADDIIIHTDSVDSHKKVLTQVLTRLRETNLTLNKDKCEFFKTELKFMGHRLSKDGIKIDESKVRAVRDAKAPQNPSEVLSFLGLVTFCAKFIPSYATIAEPLRKLTRKNVPWEWSHEQQTSFDKLKDCLTSAEVMAYYNPNAETQVISDASPWGLGVILNQRQATGDFRPVAYASRTLSDTERRYSQTEKEALAVLFGIQKFHVYLWGMKHFDSIVDHKPLERIFTASHEATPRIQNWVLKLQPYNFTVTYQPGHMMAADILSRKPMDEPDTEICTETENYLHFLTKTDMPIAVTLDELRQASEKDDTLIKVRTCLQTDTWTNRKGTLWPYFQVRDALSVQDSLLLKGNKLVIPNSLQQRVLESAHESHMGIVKTKKLIREKVWFPNMDRLVENMVKTCNACQLTTTPPQEPPVQMTDLPKTKWTELAIDFCGPFSQNEYLLVLVDFYTRYPLVEIMKSTTSQSIIRQLNKWFSLFGYPTELRTDNAPNFVSAEFTSFLREHGIKHKRSTPLFARSNGLVERFNFAGQELAHRNGQIFVTFQSYRTQYHRNSTWAVNVWATH